METEIVFEVKIKLKGKQKLRRFTSTNKYSHCMLGSDGELWLEGYATLIPADEWERFEVKAVNPNV